MVVACPRWDGPGVRRCGCRPRRGLPRGSSRWWWRAGCGSRRTRRMCGGGAGVLASKGPGGAVCRLSEAQLARLRAGLDRGPAAWGWGEDQRWTLARVTVLIGRLLLLHTIGRRTGQERIIPLVYTTV